MVRFIVDIYSHGFTIQLLYVNDKEALLEYSSDLASFEFVWMKRLRRKVRKVKAVFATASKDRMSYGFLIAELGPLMKHLKERKGYTEEAFEFKRHVARTGVKIDLELGDGVAPRNDEQAAAIDFAVEPNKINRVMNLPPGFGKALTLDSRIKIPGGWKLNGDVKVGDVITAWDGTNTNVIGVYPQGKRKVYDVKFSDGRVVTADGEHLWKVYNSRFRHYKRYKDGTNPWSIITTEEVIKTLQDSKNRLSIPLVKPEGGEERDFTIDPYLLGLLLGDGGLTHSTVRLTKSDEFIFTEAGRLAKPFGVILKPCKTDPITRSFSSKTIKRNTDGLIEMNGLGKELKKLGLLGLKSHNKFIPDEYLHGSFRQKMDLLQGLMDTDGYINKGGSTTFYTTSMDLAKGVQYLIRSIGGISSITEKYPTFTYKGEKRKGRKAYVVSIRYNKPSELFRLPRKKNRANDNGQYVNSHRLQIVEVKEAGYDECQCIAIDHPDKLFVTNDFVVTHNTYSALDSIHRLGVRAALVMSSGHFKTWTDSIKWVYKDEKSFCLVKGKDSLCRLLQLALAGQNDYKLIFISLATYRSYIKDYLETGQGWEGVHPRQLFDILGVGYKIIDEAHQSIHAIAIQNIFTHIHRTLYLSATLVTEDPFLKKQYDKMFPYDDIFKDVSNNSHAVLTSVSYYIEKFDKIRCTGGQGYSHVVFEQWLMKNKSILNNYIEMVEFFIKDSFIRKRQPGQKALVFCSTTELCKIVADSIRTTFGDEDLSVSDYVSSHADSVLYDNDIVVSTPASAGTGKDIPNLRVAISTCAIGSIQLNQQMAGRLRPMKDYPDTPPEYIWLSCRNIPKHMEYDRRRKNQLKDSCKEIKDKHYQGLI